MIAASASAAVAASAGRLDWSSTAPKHMHIYLQREEKGDGIGMSGILMQWCKGDQAVGTDASKLPFHTFPSSSSSSLSSLSTVIQPIREFGVTQDRHFFSSLPVCGHTGSEEV